jgi:hypothetical protein
MAATYLQLLKALAAMPEHLLDREVVFRDLSPGERTYVFSHILTPMNDSQVAMLSFVIKRQVVQSTILHPSVVAHNVRSLTKSTDDSVVLSYLREQISSVALWLRPNFALNVMNRVAGTNSLTVEEFFAEGAPGCGSSPSEEVTLLTRVYSELHETLPPELIASPEA